MIIFDFDQTLVDTSPVENLRRQKRWGEVMAKADQLTVYEGIDPLLTELAGAGHSLAIVTHSPSMVPEYFVKHYGWPIKTVIGYHQAKVRKPLPGGLLLAMKDCKPEEIRIHVGDRPEDTEASRAAGMISIGAEWGCVDPAALKASKPDHICRTVKSLRSLLLDELLLPIKKGSAKP